MNPISLDADVGLWVAVFGLSLLLLAFVLESIRSKRLEDENATLLHLANTHSNKQQSPSLNLTGAANRLSLAAGESFAKAPFPMWLVSPNGVIIVSNQLLQTLYGSAQVKTMADLDKAIGTSLGQYLGPRTTPIQNPVYVREELSDGSIHHRVFQAVRWPVESGKRTVGYVFSLHEQTKAYERRHSQDTFEQQVIRYLRHAAERTYHHAQTTRQGQDGILSALAEEMVMIGRYLDSMHHHVRSRHSAEHVDLLTCIRSQIKTMKSGAAHSPINVLSTLPKSASIIGNSGEVSLALQVLSDMILATLRPTQSIRFHVYREDSDTILTISTPEKKTSYTHEDELTAFGHSDSPLPADIRFQRLQLAIVKQIVLKHHGDMEVYSDPSDGTTYKLLFPSSPARR